MKLSEFNTLEDAQAYQITTDTKQVGSGQARGYLVNTNDLWKTLKLFQSDITHALFSLADAIITTASDAQSYFGMDITKADGVSNRAGIDILVQAQVMTQVEADGFIAMTLSTIYPFATTTQSQLNAAKDIFTAKQIAFTAGKDIVVTLNTALPEKVAVTTWRVEAGFEDENAGRNAYVQTAQKYRINMQGKKSGNYELRIPLVGIDFSVELI